MRRIRLVRRIFVAGFLSLVAGVLLGSIHDSLVSPATAEENHVDNEIHCLTNIIHREGRGEMRGVRYLIAITTIARRDDPDTQWPKTICGLAFQKQQMSGVMIPLNMPPPEEKVWEENHAIAMEVYRGAWKTQKLPQGWECVRYWKISDSKLKKLSAKGRAQLGITRKKRGVNFFSKLRAVATIGSISFYRDPKRCVKKLPTT